MGMRRYLLVAAVLASSNTGAHALEPGDAFECSVVKYSLVSTSLTSDAANEQRQLGRTYSIIVGDKDITVVAKFPQSDSITDEYPIVFETEAGGVYATISGNAGMNSVVISGSPNEGFHSMSISGQSAGTVVTHLLQCEKL